MNPPLPYHRLHTIESKMTLRQNEHPIEASVLDFQTRELLSVSRREGFIGLDQYGRLPRVYLFGVTHANVADINQRDELSRIFSETMQPNDLHLTEGIGREPSPPGETPYNFYLDSKLTLIGALKSFFIDNHIRTIWNDDGIAANEMDEHFKILHSFKYTNPDYLSNQGYYRLADQIMELMDKRDMTITDHRAAGIIPLIKGTSTNYQPLASDRRIYQVVGIGHLFSGIIAHRLREEGVQYITFMPQDHPIIGTVFHRPKNILIASQG